jgi:hypothetical protein
VTRGVQRRLPLLVVYRGRVWVLSETRRGGLVLERATGANMVDKPRGRCVVLGPHRVSLRGRRNGASSHSPGESVAADSPGLSHVRGPAAKGGAM